MSGSNGQFALESLENRRLLSAAGMPINHAPLHYIGGNALVRGLDGSVFQLQGDVIPRITRSGTLVIEGTSIADTISVKLGRGEVDVTLSLGKTHAFRIGFDANLVKRIRVEAGGGNDRAGIADDIGRNCTLAGGGGNDTLVGSAGDTLIGGRGNDKLVAQFAQHDLFVTFGSALTADPEGAGAVLTGGRGKDVLVGGENDTVVGGHGDDLAIFHTRIGLGEGTDPHAYGREQFGSRAFSIEQFDTSPKSQPVMTFFAG